MENINIANYVNIFASVCDSKAKDPFNCVLFKCYKFMKLRTYVNMSNASETRQAVIE